MVLFKKRTDSETQTSSISDTRGEVACGKITIPDEVTDIEQYAFYRCTGLKGVDLNLANSIGREVFAICPLSMININSQNTMYKLVGTPTDGYIQKLNDFDVLSPTCGDMGGIAELDSNINEIGQEAFYGCAGIFGIDLTNVSILDADWCRRCPNLHLVTISDKTYETHDSDFWDDVGPEEGCILYTPSLQAGQNFIENVIGEDPNNSKWSIEIISAE